MAAVAGKTHIPSGTVFTWGGSPVYIYERPGWDVEPRETVTGSIGSYGQWQARRAHPDAEAPPTEVQMVRYNCRIQVIDPSGYGGPRARDSLMFEFDVMHRPEDGDLMLGAKVLSMAVTQPEWELYKERVREGW